MPKDRDINQVSQRLGKDFLKLIEDRIKEKGKVKILDAGCGYGVAMLGFLKKYGNKIEVVGFNYSKRSGNIEIMKKKAIDRKIFTDSELKKIKLPKIYYFDASKKWPFKANSFDFVYSLNVLYLIDDKINFLEECNRVLDKKGIVRIEPGFDLKSKKFWEIWHKGKEVSIPKYLNSINGTKVKKYIEISKQRKLDFKLKLISSIDFNFIWTRWAGVKSIYTTQLKFKPFWKR